MKSNEELHRGVGNAKIEGGRGPLQIAVKAEDQRPPTVKNAILTRGESVAVDRVSVTLSDSGLLGELVTIVRP